ncbi:MAG: hypothetical protein ABSF83_00420 [Nitrososphaerales archaeon]|jgi:hypothetical protein
MGRKAVLFGFWLIGYALGFFAWLVAPSVINSLQGVGLSSDMAGAFVTGLGGSMVMLVGVMLWGRLSSN